MAEGAKGGGPVGTLFCPPSMRGSTAPVFPRFFKFHFFGGLDCDAPAKGAKYED